MKRLPFLLLSLCVSLPAVAAERLVVRLQHGGTLGEAEAERVLSGTENLARELTGLTVTRVPEGLLTGRCGAADACLRSSVAAEAKTEHVLVLGVVPRRQGMLDMDVGWVDTVRGVVARRAVGGVSAAALTQQLRPVVAALVPAFARRGWGGLVAPGTARLRVDGRMESAEVVALTAGPHEVDLLLPSGEARLTREQVQEGVRLRLEPRPDFLPGGATESRAPRGKGLRTASYITFSVGALAVAGSLVAGGLSRGALRGVEPCEGRQRDCTSFPTAAPAHEQAGRYARTGNVLLGAGAGLGAVGAGLFVFDLLSTKSE